MDYLFLLLDLVMLIASAEVLVRGAVAVAVRLKISPLVIGMTIVSLGTSAPELFVSIKAALNGHPDVSIGTVIGSNISNISLILGVAAVIFPIVVSNSTLYKDWPMMMLATLLFYVFCLDTIIVWEEGAVMVFILLIYSAWILHQSRKKGLKDAEDIEIVGDVKNTPLWRSFLFILLGSIGLIFGADYLLESVINIATQYGVSEKMLSLTVVALGTSFPELITSAVAAFKKEADISIGNLVGSNLFNILGILGITALVHPIGISLSILRFDMFFVIGISLLIFPIMYFGKKVGRLRGIFLCLVYITYIFITIHSEI